MTALLVLLGGALGAPARYLVDRAVQARHRSAFPWGTWVVNVLGSFLLGVTIAAVVTAGLPPAVTAVAGSGFCGALTTYATFGHETVRLLATRRWWLALVNVAGSVVATVTAVAAGAALTQALWG